MKYQRFFCSSSVTACVMLGTAAVLGVCSSQAHAQWTFAGGYQEAPYTETARAVAHQTRYDGYESWQDTAGNWQLSPYGTSSSSWSGAAGVSVNEAIAQSDCAAYGGRGYTGSAEGDAYADIWYHPLFIWSGDGIGNPDHSITAALVSANGSGSATPSSSTSIPGGTGGMALFSGGLSLSGSGGNRGWGFNYMYPNGSTGNGISSTFILSTFPVSASLSVGDDEVHIYASSHTWAYSDGPQFSAPYHTTAAVGLDYTVTSN